MIKTNLKNKSQFGFTLIELVIVITILSVVMGITYSALNQLMRSRKFLDDQREIDIVASSLISRLSRELQLASRDYSVLPLPSEDSNRVRPRLNLVGESKSIEKSDSADSIRFMALDGGQYLPDGGTHSGTVEINYRIEEDPDQANSQVQTYLLIRQETPNIRPIEKAREKVINFPIAKNVLSLRFRYFSSENDQWYETWGSDGREGLPDRVSISFKLRSPLGDVREFVTAVAIVKFK